MKILFTMSLFLFCTSLSASEFWADRLGGGAEDVLVDSLMRDGYTGVSAVDAVTPIEDGENVAFEVNADSDAVIVFSDEVSLTDIVVQDESGEIVNTDSVLEATAEPQAFRISKGNRKITLTNTRNNQVDSNKDWSGKTRSSVWAGYSGRDRNISADPAATEADDSVAIVNLEESSNALATSTTRRVTGYGTITTISAHIVDNVDHDSDTRSISGRPVRVARAAVKAIIKFPDGRKRKVLMKDSGKSAHGDAVKGDFIYSYKLKATQAGEYRIKVRFKGLVDGSKFKRTDIVHEIVDDTRLKVVSRETYVTTGDVLGQPMEEGRFGLPVSVRVKQGNMPDIVRTRAEIWARDANGQEVVVGWVGGLVAPEAANSSDGRWTLPFTFHSGWLDNAHLPPYTMKAIEVSDLETGDDLVFNVNREVEILGMEPDGMTTRRAMKRRSDDALMLEMTRGVHPDQLEGTGNNISQFRNRRVSDRVLFLQGYCTANGPKIDHFHQNVKNDALNIRGRTLFRAKANRLTADARALEAARYFNFKRGSFRAVVAHSHGGLVAASLLNDYSYMFTDSNVLRVRAVTMGSPFYGAMIANRSNSELGRFLRKYVDIVPSCRVPYDLKKSTNYRWRNKISSRARHQIASYYTTHTKDYWYDPRNCTRASSSWIPGHDDGTTKPSEGLGFAQGKEFSFKYSGYCHEEKMGQNHQWKHPQFVNYVNWNIP